MITEKTGEATTVFAALDPDSCDSFVYGLYRPPTLGDNKKYVECGCTIRASDCGKSISWEFELWRTTSHDGYNLLKIRRAIEALTAIEALMIEGQAEYDRLKATIVNDDDKKETTADRETVAHG